MMSEQLGKEIDALSIALIRLSAEESACGTEAGTVTKQHVSDLIGALVERHLQCDTPTTVATSNSSPVRSGTGSSSLPFHVGSLSQTPSSAEQQTPISPVFNMTDTKPTTRNFSSDNFPSDWRATTGSANTISPSPKKRQFPTGSEDPDTLRRMMFQHSKVAQNQMRELMSSLNSAERRAEERVNSMKRQHQRRERDWEETHRAIQDQLLKQREECDLAKKGQSEELSNSAVLKATIRTIQVKMNQLEVAHEEEITRLEQQVSECQRQFEKEHALRLLTEHERQAADDSSKHAGMRLHTSQEEKLKLKERILELETKLSKKEEQLRDVSKFVKSSLKPFVALSDDVFRGGDGAHKLKKVYDALP